MPAAVRCVVNRRHHEDRTNLHHALDTPFGTADLNPAHHGVGVAGLRGQALGR